MKTTLQRLIDFQKSKENKTIQKHQQKLPQKKNEEYTFENLPLL